MAALAYATTANTGSWIATTYSANTFATQPVLTFTGAGGLPEGVRKARFEEFHAANPKVYNHLACLVEADLARRRVGAGIHKKISVRQIIDQLRYERGAKIDNNHIKFYTLKLMEDYADHAHLFRVRGRP